MGLLTGVCLPVVARSCGDGVVLESPLDGGGGMVVTGLLGGCGGSGGHTEDPTSRESRPASLAPSLGARVLVGRPCGQIRIHVVCLYIGLRGIDSGTGMTSTGSSSLSTTATTTKSSSSSSPTASSSSPSPSPGDENIGCLYATGYGHEPIPWMMQGGSHRPHGESAGSEGSIGL
jgi:hypothetical protein